MEKAAKNQRYPLRNTIVKIFSGIHISRIKNRSWQTMASILLVFASITSGLITYAALNEAPPFGENPNLVIWLLNLDLIFLLLLASLIARRIVSVWSGRRRGLAGSHLHVRLVYIFSALVAIPTITMTVFSAFFFHFGVQAWFSQRVQTAINESQAVAQSYLEEHKQVIRADTMAMANDLDRQVNLMILDENKIAKALDTQAYFRNLSEAIILKGNGRVLGRSSLTFSLEYEKPPSYELRQADSGDVVLMTSEKQDRVRALVKLQNFENTYLFVGRMLDPRVLAHLNSAELAVTDYKNLQTQYSSLQITVTMIFVLVGFLLLLAAIWAGLLLARQLISPIGALIQASDRVRTGDLNSRIDEDNMLEEFEYLARSFNRMTAQLQTQRSELLEANRQVDQRRHLIETVLSGVSSGVIGVNHQGIVNLANNAATKLLSKPLAYITNAYILDIIPELDPLLNEFSQRPIKSTQGEITITIKNNNRTFVFTVSVETLDEDKAGLIITFDDITDLQSAQRNAAWSDVARRIAHEIKNPLTPIQLSAERLKRKYLQEISNEKDQLIFEKCTNTIVKHVGDIGKMVDEFSSFARMPEADIHIGDIIKPLQETLILSKEAHKDILFDVINITDNTHVYFDQRLLRQTVTNLVQNACDALKHEHNEKHIQILTGQHNQYLFIAFTDNGIGFPQGEDITKLADPYITHKEKGTGLGLAIVKKIMDDHKGELIIGAPEWLKDKPEWQNLGGACLVLTFPSANVVTPEAKGL